MKNKRLPSPTFLVVLAVAAFTCAGCGTFDPEREPPPPSQHPSAPPAVPPPGY